MRTERSDPAYILDMLQAAKEVSEFLSGVTVGAYLSNKMIRAAVERKIEIIGEAARGVTEAFRNAHPEIPWRAIVAQRNVIAHDYGDIKHEKLWNVASVKIVEVIPMLEIIVEELMRSDKS